MDNTTWGDPLKMTIVTGFLGSGKSTLIRRFIETEAGSDTGVIVNEFGETGVDHQLFIHAAEQVELVDGGCLCCARRDDVAKAMYRLVQLNGKEKGFSRAILETSGLADPAPIISTLARDPWLKSHVELASVVTVLDAVTGVQTIRTEAECRRQLALADTVVISKTDMRNAASMDELRTAISEISPATRILDAGAPDFDALDVLGAQAAHILTDTLSQDALPDSHSGDIYSFTLKIDRQIDWPAFTVWLSALLHHHGDDVLRVKGLLRTTSAQTRLAIHGVQHVMHPPTHMPVGEDDSGDSFLVFILRGITRADICDSLAEFLRLPALKAA